MQLPISELLDPDFSCSLALIAIEYDSHQSQADDFKWHISRKVNSEWDEHKTLFNTKKDYFAECSRVMNLSGRKYFSESGETLRRWCETQATYETFLNEVQDAEKFLDLLSFDHLYKAKKAYSAEKVTSPFDALKLAIENGWSADDMMEHYFPPQGLKFDVIRSLSGWLEKLPHKMKLTGENAKILQAKIADLLEFVKGLE